MSDLLREIDDEIARDKNEQFLEKWGMPIGVFLAVLIGGLFFFFNWQNQTERRALAEATSFEESIQLMLADPEAASNILTDLTNSDSGFAELSNFKIGDSLWLGGQLNAAVEAWTSYLENPNSNEHLAMATRMKLAWFGHGLIPNSEIAAHIEVLGQRSAYSDLVPVLKALSQMHQGNVPNALETLDLADKSENATLASSLAEAVASLAKSL